MRCANCGAELVGEYCHTCGQRSIGDDDLAMGPTRATWPAICCSWIEDGAQSGRALGRSACMLAQTWCRYAS